MVFKKYFLDHKLFWGFISFFFSILVVLKFVYSPWVNRANQSAIIFLSMQPKLKWIVTAQEEYKRRKGTYAGDLKSLIEEAHNITPKTLALDLAKQVEKYKSNPGLNYGKSHAGAFYYFEITAADAENFLAQASYIGFADRGQDVWQVDKSGTMVNKIKSELLSKAKEKQLLERALSWWLLASLVLFIWGLGEKVYRLINGQSSKKTA